MRLNYGTSHLDFQRLKLLKSINKVYMRLGSSVSGAYAWYLKQKA